MVYQYQEDYYRAIRASTALGESTPFIEFMLQMILAAMNEVINDEGVGVNVGVNDHDLPAVQQHILSLLRTSPQMTIQALADATGKSSRTIERHLKSLREAKAIERVGSDKTGVWKVLR